MSGSEQYLTYINFLDECFKEYTIKRHAQKMLLRSMFNRPSIELESESKYKEILSYLIHDAEP